jgi:hypothetical protein
MRQIRVLGIAVSMLVAAVPASAEILRGGGNITTDCVMVFDVPGANKPAPPKTPKMVDCIDGDPTCDEDGLRNGQCVFDIRACINSTDYVDCTPDTVNSSVVDHAIDDGEDSRFDNDWLALQDRINGFGFPAFGMNSCSLFSAVTVRLAGPDSNNLMKKARKNLRVTSEGVTVDGEVSDIDKVKFTCRPEGDRIYLPTDLYSGTFDRIRKQIFTPSCAISTCHDSESHENDLILLAGAAYSNLVNVTPYNPAADLDGLMRVTPGDPAMSYLYRKITAHTDTLPFGYGDPMPLDDDALDPELIDLVEKWILGDGVLGPAPETGWVEGTDQ